MLFRMRYFWLFLPSTPTSVVFSTTYTISVGHLENGVGSYSTSCVYPLDSHNTSNITENATFSCNQFSHEFGSSSFGKVICSQIFSFLRMILSLGHIIGKEWEELFSGEWDSARCALLLVTCQEGNNKYKNAPQSLGWIKAKKEGRCWNPELRERVGELCSGHLVYSLRMGSDEHSSNLSLTPFPAGDQTSSFPVPQDSTETGTIIGPVKAGNQRTGGVTKLNIGKEKKSWSNKKIYGVQVIQHWVLDMPSTIPIW